MNKEIRILVIEDVAADVVLMNRELSRGGLAFEAKRVETRDEFLREIEQCRPDIILSDHGLPSFDGFAALQLARERCPNTPFIFVTGSMGEELAIDSLRSGATDYVLKTRMSNLAPAVERALRLADAQNKRHEAEPEAAASEERARRWTNAAREPTSVATDAREEHDTRRAAAFDTALDAIIAFDPAGTIVDWNPAAEQIFGYRRDDALGRSMESLLAPRPTHDVDHNGLRRFLRTGRGRVLGRRIEVAALNAAGDEFPIELTITRVASEGETTFLSFSRDISDRRHTEEALRKSEERFRLLVEGVEDYAIFMLDPRGCISTWNAGAERIMGFRAREIIGRRLHRFYPTDDVAEKKPDEALTAATEQGRFQEERALLRKDGTSYWANFVLTALRDESGALNGFSAIARDITPRKQAEHEIRRLNAELERRVQERTAELEAAYQELEAFSYSISHDLRAPLLHIAGFAEMLKSDLADVLDEKSRRHLRTICDSTENMGRMIADLLTYSRIGRADLQKVRFNLGDTLKEVRRDLQAQTSGRNVTWIVPPLPEVYGDPFLLRQALFNLIANALKFTRPSAEARIEIVVETREAEQIFGIRDNGVGFDMNYAGKLFGVFQRLHSANEFEGSGIGLANVRRIVTRHGGRTWAEGAVDRGATFYFSLPVKQETAP